jgi:hypothetical protein
LLHGFTHLTGGIGREELLLLALVHAPQAPEAPVFIPIIVISRRS